MSGNLQFLAILGAVVGGIYLWCSRGYLFSRRWPETLGTVESCRVKTDRMLVQSTVPLEVATAEIGYSYKIRNEYYSGYYEESFTDEQRAWDYVHSVEGHEVLIRYNRRHPEKSYMEGIVAPG